MRVQRQVGPAPAWCSGARRSRPARCPSLCQCLEASLPRASLSQRLLCCPAYAASHLYTPAGVHQHYIGLVNNILDLPAYRLHAKALAAIPYPRLAVASMLLRQTLPAVAAALEAGSSPAPHERCSISALEAHVLLGMTADALRRDQLLPAVAQLSHQPGNYFVPLAARIIRALPTSVEGLPSGVAPGELGNAHCNAASCWLGCGCLSSQQIAAWRQLALASQDPPLVAVAPAALRLQWRR